MPHPHESLLKEYQFAITHLVPTVPEEIKSQAQKMYDDLLANESAAKEEIIIAMSQTGLAEYPHRHAFEELKTDGSETVDASSAEYQTALANWQKHTEEINQQINELEGLKDQDPKWSDEIANKAARFREGFLVTERDPELEEVKKEIEYWQGRFGQEI